MKATKILAGMSAAALAASMLTMVNAFAADSDFTVTAQSTDWTEVTAEVKADDTSATLEFASAKGLTNLGFITDGGSVTVYSITVNGEYTVPVDVTLDGASKTDNGLANIWNDAGRADVVFEGDGFGFYGDGGSSITFKVDGEAVAISTLTYNFTEDTSSDETTSSETTSSEDSSSNGSTLIPADSVIEYPDDAIFGNAGTSWQGFDFAALKGQRIGTAWDGGWLQIDYGKEDYDADISNAKLVMVAVTDEEVEAGTPIFRVGDTADGTPFQYDAPEAGSVFTYELDLEDFLAANDHAGYPLFSDNAWDGGFGCNFQLGTSSTFSIYVTGVEYTEKPVTIENVWSGEQVTGSREDLLYLSPEELGLDDYTFDGTKKLIITYHLDGSTGDTWNTTLQAQNGELAAFYDGGKTPDGDKIAYLIDYYYGGEDNVTYDEDGNATGVDKTYTIALADTDEATWSKIAEEGLSIGGYNIVITSVDLAEATPEDDNNGGDNSSDPTESNPSNTESNPTTETTSGTASTSSAATSSAASSSSDSNPSTGAAALGAVGVLLAGAAMVVAKKKD
jgi:hypothetical protein